MPQRLRGRTYLLDLEDHKMTVQRISAAARRVRRYGYRLS